MMQSLRSALIATVGSVLVLAGCAGDEDERRLYVNVFIDNLSNEDCGPGSAAPMDLIPCNLAFESGVADLVDEDGIIVATSDVFEQLTGLRDGWRAEFYTEPLASGRYTVRIPDCGEIEVSNNGGMSTLTPAGQSESYEYATQSVQGSIDPYVSGTRCGGLYEDD